MDRDTAARDKTYRSSASRRRRKDEQLGASVGKTFASDDYGPELMLWREAQLAIEELMIRNDGGIIDTAGVTQFLASGRLYIHDASITALPFPDSSLDGVITVNTIYFIADLDQAFRELARTLKSSDRAVIGVGDPGAMERCRSPFMAFACALSPTSRHL
jgi:arsenite methyltransferase